MFQCLLFEVILLLNLFIGLYKVINDDVNIATKQCFSCDNSVWYLFYSEFVSQAKLNIEQ